MGDERVTRPNRTACSTPSPTRDRAPGHPDPKPVGVTSVGRAVPAPTGSLPWRRGGIRDGKAGVMEGASATGRPARSYTLRGGLVERRPASCM